VTLILLTGRGKTETERRSEVKLERIKVVISQSSEVDLFFQRSTISRKNRHLTAAVKTKLLATIVSFIS
jgi:hypothetical protein